MELVAIRNARFIAAISLEEINPRGLAVYPFLIGGLIDKYKFSIFPDLTEPLDETKGIVFEDGIWNDKAIDKVTIFPDGIVIDTRSSTNDSETIFEEAMAWVSESIGLTYKPEMVTRRVYLSEIIIRSNVALSYLNPALQPFAEKISKSISNNRGLNLSYECSGITFYFNAAQINSAPAPFRIERLENTSYSENKYYSVAPFPTDEHISYLEEFESILLSSK